MVNETFVDSANHEMISTIISKLKNLSIPQVAYIIVDVILAIIIFISNEPLLYIFGFLFVIEIILVILTDRGAFILFEKKKNKKIAKTKPQ